MIRQALAGGLVAGACLLGISCAKQPPTHYYLLEAAVPAIAQMRQAGITIGVRSLAVDTPYDEAAIVYRVGPDSPEVGFYAYHEWASPLSRMLPRLISDALAGTPGVASIEPAAPGESYDALMEGRLIALEEVDLEGKQQVQLRMNLRLTTDDSEIWSETLHARGSTTTDQVAGIVGLMNQVILNAVDELREDFAAAIALQQRDP